MAQHDISGLARPEGFRRRAVFFPYIGQQAFSTSGQLREIYSYITNPADGNYHANSFVDIENAILFVPKGTVDEYEQLSPWNKARLITEMSGR